MMEHTILGPGFAVEIKSVDLSEEQTPEAVNAMRDLWLQHKVAVFREQNLEESIADDFVFLLGIRILLLIS